VPQAAQEGYQKRFPPAPRTRPAHGDERQVVVGAKQSVQETDGRRRRQQNQSFGQINPLESKYRVNYNKYLR